jgi:hypothetical protein
MHVVSAQGRDLPRRPTDLCSLEFRAVASFDGALVDGHRGAAAQGGRMDGETEQFGLHIPKST